jgi:hypothetical protein
MIPNSEINLELFADYFQFYLQDESADSNLGDKWTKEAVDILLALADGTIGIGTVRNMDVPINIKIFNEEPQILKDDHDLFGQINECDIEIKSGRIVVAGCTDYFPDAKRINVESGIYRTRIYYANLEKISEDGLVGEDFYEIHLWLTNKKDDLKVIKKRKACP